MIENNINSGSCVTAESNRNIIDFSQIIGHIEVKERVLSVLAACVSGDKEREEYLKRIGAHNSKGILLYSKPGLGKTEVLRAIERSLKNHPLIEAEYLPGSLFQGTAGKNSKMIESTFDRARKTKKMVFLMLLDEIDSIMMKKRGMLNVSERTNALLAEMDGMKDSSNIVIIATTNRIKNIEDAVLSRFKTFITLQAPEEPERLEFISKFISPIKFDKPYDEAILARDTKGFTGRNFRDIGSYLIDIQAITHAPVPTSTLIIEVNKYMARAAVVRNTIDMEDGD